MSDGEVRTYVWSPLHKIHNYERAGVYPTYLGVLCIWKCDKCGDIQIKVEKWSGHQRISVSTTSISIEDRSTVVNRSITAIEKRV